MKLFLTGASGILGTDITLEAQRNDWDVLGFDSKQIDITNLSDVKRKVTDFKPDVIIHCAAMTNVDLCEEDKDGAFLANVIGSHNLSLAASTNNIKIVYVSSCGVYGNGKQGAHCEIDATNPVNYHHYTKLLGEARIKEHNNNFIIIRPGWLFGGSQNHKKNFVEARRKEALKVETLKSATDKLGCPTYTLDAAKQIMTLINLDLCGTFNIINEGSGSRFDYVTAIIESLALKNIIQPVSSNEFPRKANMPDNEVLENMHLRLRNINYMRPWRDALRDYVDHTY